ncbi:MAG TPA: FGGY family carbohydrate kinase [Acidimicrobiia bacterium]|nr:FGGY family carbohydrate kinase [Acidimicrobiia bacterium]
MTVLTFDFGTSATKVGLWSGPTLVALTRAPIETRHPAPGSAEQDPESWWEAAVDAAAQARVAAPDAYERVRVVAASTARETFACVDEELRPLGPGILWSDTRGRDEVAVLGDPTAFRARTGVQATAGSCAAKIAWVRAHEPDRFRASSWLLGPRDLVFARLTGRVETDPTVASRTGLYALDGTYLGDEALAERLPALASSVDARPIARHEMLELPGEAVAVLGAGDRACEVLGVGAGPDAPMLSFGTTANVSVPHDGPALPSVAQVSRAVGGGYLVEAGLSVAGAALDWLASLTGRSRGELLARAADVPPGADGLLALPWLQGARAPWWHADARAVFSGVTSSHGPAELARALLEGVALDAARSVELVAPASHAVVLAGAGARDPTWATIVAALTGRDVVRRRLDDAASAGARLLAEDDDHVTLESVNPVTRVDAPDPTLVDAYQRVRAASDALAARLLGPT